MFAVILLTKPSDNNFLLDLKKKFNKKNKKYYLSFEIHYISSMKKKYRFYFRVILVK